MHDELAAELSAALRGRVLADPLSRALYATDASIYQIEPLAVALPRDADDVAAALRLARRRGVPLLPRGGGTSLAGQAVGRAIHLDFSHSMGRLLELDAAGRSAWVEPGMVLDTLNAQLAPHGLLFAPDVSPSNRATVGGMIANNSSGMYSLVFGKTIDHVLELKVMLADGSVAHLRDLDGPALHEKLALPSHEGRCYRVVERLAREHAAEVERRFPKLLRRVGGYNLDAFAPGRPFNLSRIVVGSEGTLAIVLAARLRLVPRPRQTAIAILAFESLDAALEAVVPCLECRPAAVELIDDILLDLTRRSREYRRSLESFVAGTPAALLQVELFGDGDDELRAGIDALERHVCGTHGIACAVTRAVTPTERQAVLQVRKAGMPLLQSLSPDLKPETFVEDTAVAPERLAAYVRRFRAICAAHGVRVAFYGHASVGLLHARPLLNLKDAGDVRTMRAIAEAVRDLVLEFGGALSGEHGDGMLRAEFNRAMFGDVLYEAFRELKRTFDPQGLLNPGKIVDAPPMDANLRSGAGQRRFGPRTHYRFADTGGMAGAAELCNGNGLCRKPGGGTMCPSYMVTRDEEHSTRGRANALRMILTGALPPGELTGRRMREVMELCVECKGCTAECPSRVNMTRLKSEWLAQLYAAEGVPLRARLFGHIRRVCEVGSALAPLANLALAAPPAAWLGERVLGISGRRRLPHFAHEPFHRWFARRRGGDEAAGAAGSVVLFPDTFADYQEPAVARAAVRVLEAAGYRVLLPSRRVCCGRPLLSKGLLPEAKELVRRQLDALGPYVAAGIPVVGLEPSCVLSFRDEYPDLVDDPRAAALAGGSFLLDEFLAREVDAGRARLPLRGAGGAQRFLLHGHCHQKALVGSAASLALLRQIPGADVREVDSGCCGMAGSFGYEAEHHEISMRMAERALLPAVRALPAEATIVASGTSCRQQIADGAGRPGRHLAEVLADALDPVRRVDRPPP